MALQWVISYESYPCIKIMEIGKANFRKANTNTEIYVKTRKEKNHRERKRFHYNYGDYNGDSLVC